MVGVGNGMGSVSDFMKVGKRNALAISSINMAVAVIKEALDNYINNFCKVFYPYFSFSIYLYIFCGFWCNEPPRLGKIFKNFAMSGQFWLLFLSEK